MGWFFLQEDGITRRAFDFLSPPEGD